VKAQQSRSFVFGTKAPSQWHTGSKRVAGAECPRTHKFQHRERWIRFPPTSGRRTVSPKKSRPAVLVQYRCHFDDAVWTPRKRWAITRPGVVSVSVRVTAAPGHDGCKRELRPPLPDTERFRIRRAPAAQQSLQNSAWSGQHRLSVPLFKVACVPAARTADCKSAT